MSGGCSVDGCLFVYSWTTSRNGDHRLDYSRWEHSRTKVTRTAQSTQPQPCHLPFSYQSEQEHVSWLAPSRPTCSHQLDHSLLSEGRRLSRIRQRAPPPQRAARLSSFGVFANRLTSRAESVTTPTHTTETCATHVVRPRVDNTVVC